jgi:hypothetical protein
MIGLGVVLILSYFWKARVPGDDRTAEWVIAD